MSVYVTEFGGYLSGRPFSPGVPNLPALNNQTMSISSASTAQLGAATRMIMLSADTGAWLLFGSSGSTTVATSTSGFRIPAGFAPQLFNVSPNMRITALST